MEKWEQRTSPYTWTQLFSFTQPKQIRSNICMPCSKNITALAKSFSVLRSVLFHSALGIKYFVFSTSVKKRRARNFSALSTDILYSVHRVQSLNKHQYVLYMFMYIILKPIFHASVSRRLLHNIWREKKRERKTTKVSAILKIPEQMLFTKFKTAYIFHSQSTKL